MARPIPDHLWEQIIAAAEADDNIGICLACGAETGGVEPDARMDPCEVCDENQVYGAQELVIMGYAD
jgi:hypothetical protein